MSADQAAEWSVFVVAQTIADEVLLKMTEAQATKLRDRLVWLMSEDDTPNAEQVTP